VGGEGRRAGLTRKIAPLPDEAVARVFVMKHSLLFRVMHTLWMSNPA